MSERKRIADCNVNDHAVIPLVVLTATDRLTKGKKPYLQLELFDGVDKINGNYWDWSSGNIPEKNAILNVTCQITEWQGNKQLNISKLTSCTEYPIADFMPSSGTDIDFIFQQAECLVDTMEDMDLQRIATECLKQLARKWKEVPGAITVHHAYAAGTLIHSVETAKIARGIASALEEANMDLVTAAALLHDLGKLFSYRVTGVVIEHTTEGHLFDHTFIGGNFISNFADHVTDIEDPGVKAKIDLLIHCILSHHGKLDYGAAVPPVMLEAHIVSHADGISAAAEIIRTAKAQGPMWTERIWALENKPHVQLAYSKRIFEYQGGEPPEEYTPMPAAKPSSCCTKCNAIGPCEHDGV